MADSHLSTDQTEGTVGNPQQPTPAQPGKDWPADLERKGKGGVSHPEDGEETEKEAIVKKKQEMEDFQEEGDHDLADAPPLSEEDAELLQEIHQHPAVWEAVATLCYKKEIAEHKSDMQSFQRQLQEMQTDQLKREEEWKLSLRRMEQETREREIKILRSREDEEELFQRQKRDMEIREKRVMDDMTRIMEQHEEEKRDWERQIAELEKRLQQAPMAPSSFVFHSGAQLKERREAGLHPYAEQLPAMGKTATSRKTIPTMEGKTVLPPSYYTEQRNYRRRMAEEEERKWQEATPARAPPPRFSLNPEEKDEITTIPPQRNVSGQEMFVPGKAAWETQQNKIEECQEMIRRLTIQLQPNRGIETRPTALGLAPMTPSMVETPPPNPVPQAVPLQSHPLNTGTVTTELREKEAECILEYFYGSEDKKNSWPQYARLFDRVAHRRRWTYAQKGQILAAKMKGDALRAVENLPEEQWEDYRALKQALNNCYTPKQKSLNYRLELCRREQQPGESVEEYAQVLRRMAEIAYPDEPDKDRHEERSEAVLHAFMGGVGDPVTRVHLRDRWPPTLTEAVALVEGYNDAWKSRRADNYAASLTSQMAVPTEVTAAINNSPATPAYSSVGEKNKGKKKGKQPPKEKPKEDATTVSLAQVKQLITQGLKNAQQRPKNKDIICYRCQKRGHKAYNCRTSATAAGLEEIRAGEEEIENLN